MAFAITGARIFNGTDMLDGHAVVVEAGKVGALLPADQLPPGIERHEVEGLLAPASSTCR